MEIYKPREDSLMLALHVRKHAFGRVLDMGTGTGIQAEEALKGRKVKTVLAVDINPGAVKLAKEKGLNAKQSDLFSNVKGKFDTIIFNPPYLPEDEGIEDASLYGGKKGYETTERFLNEANRHLNKDGIILLIFSSLTNKDKVDEIIENNCLEYEELEKKKIFFEELYVYIIRKTKLLKELEKKKITDIRKLTKGHRGLIFVGKKDKKKYAIKVQRKDIGAFNTVNREADFLKKLNKEGIGPKLWFKGEDYFAYEFVPGVFIPEYMENNSKQEIINVLREVFKQCHKLDKLGIDKEEMHHPYKHVVVGRKVVLLDFERANYTEKPKNVTQFCQYVTSGIVTRILESKGINIDKNRLRKLSADYKKKSDASNFKLILEALT